MTAMEIDSANKKARSSLLWFASSSAVWQIVSWAFTIITARILLPEDYGVMALSGSILLYIHILATLHLVYWLIQRDSFGEKEERSAFTLILILALFASFVCYSCSSIFASFLGDGRVEVIFQIYALCVFFQAMTVLPESKLKRELNYKPVALMNVVLGILRSLVTLFLAWKGYGYWSLVWGQIFRDVAACFWMHWVCPVEKKLVFDSKIFKEALKYGLYTSGGTLFWMASTKIDDLLVGKLISVEMLGFYTMAYFLSELPLSKLNFMVSSILTSYFSRIKSDSEALFRIFLQIHKGMALLLAPIFIGLAVVAPEFIPLTIGEKWRPIVPIFQVMCVVQTFIGCFGQISRLLYALNKPNLVFFCSIINFFLIAPGFFFGIKYYGESGLYFTWIVLYPLTVLIFILVLKIATGISIRRYFLNYTMPFSSVAVMGLATYFFRVFALQHFSETVVLISTILVGVVSYVLTLRLFFFEEALEVYKSIRNKDVDSTLVASSE